jgi:hypothetical protein
MNKEKYMFEDFKFIDSFKDIVYRTSISTNEEIVLLNNELNIFMIEYLEFAKEKTKFELEMKLTHSNRFLKTIKALKENYFMNDDYLSKRKWLDDEYDSIIKEILLYTSEVSLNYQIMDKRESK